MICPIKKRRQRNKFIYNLYQKLDELYNRFASGYYLDSPPYTFEKDEMNLKYMLGLLTTSEYTEKKSKLEMKIAESYYKEYPNYLNFCV